MDLVAGCIWSLEKLEPHRHRRSVSSSHRVNSTFSWPFGFISVVGASDDVCPHWRRPSALLSPLSQIFVSSRSNLRKGEMMFTRYLCTLVRVKTQKIWAKQSKRRIYFGSQWQNFSLWQLWGIKRKQLTSWDTGCREWGMETEKMVVSAGFLFPISYFIRHPCPENALLNPTK